LLAELVEVQDQVSVEREEAVCEHEAEGMLDDDHIAIGYELLETASLAQEQ